MHDLRTQLPPCPLEYQVPYIPGAHTAIVIDTHAPDIDWQEKMLPWTLASLINNTDIVMKGVHLYVLCDDATHPRIEKALQRIELPPDTLVRKPDNLPSDTPPFLRTAEIDYDSVCMLDIHYWAFRGLGHRSKEPDIKLPFGHVLRHNWSWGLADYSLHPANDILQKSEWLRITEPLHLTSNDSPEQRRKLANHLIDAAERAHWLHTANTAVYGENYKSENKNVAAHFFNETEPNWHLDASILQFQSKHVDDPDFINFTRNYGHLGTQPLIALWLLKTRQHAYNLRDSIMIDFPQFTMEKPQYPRLCNMRLANLETFRDATKHLMGAHLNISI